MFCSWVIDGCHLVAWSSEVAQGKGLTVFSFTRYNKNNNELASGSGDNDDSSAPIKSLEMGSESVRENQGLPQGIPFASSYHLGVKLAATLVVTVTWLACINWSTDPDKSKQRDSSVQWLSPGEMSVWLILEMLITAGIAACLPFAFPGMFQTNDVSSENGKNNGM